MLTLYQPGFILTAWEDDIATTVKDGFEWGEDMMFKFYDVSLDTEYVIDESAFSSVSSANPQTEPVIAAHTGGFGAGQYSVRSLCFDGPGVAVPNSYALHQNYPNPFNPATLINYDLPKHSRVTLDIYNILGQKIVTLVNDVQAAGFKSVKWEADAYSSGLYIYKLDAKSRDGNQKYNSIKKMILIK